MDTKKNLKKYKITVDRHYTERSEYYIDAPSDDCPDFHNNVHNCIEGVQIPTSVYKGMEKGVITYEETSKEFFEKNVKQSVEKEVVEEDSSPENPIIEALGNNVTLNVCPFTHIPFISDADKKIHIPFYEGTQEDVDVIYSPWLDLYIDLSKPNFEDTVTNRYKKQILNAVSKFPEIYFKLKTSD